MTAGLQSVQVLDVIARFEDDYGDDHDVLNPKFFPEARGLREADPDEPSTYLTLGVSLAYNRDANVLWDNVVELHERKPEVFEIGSDVTEDEIADITADIGFRYKNRDAGVLATNRAAIEKYGSVESMISETGRSAPSLLSLVRNDDDFTHLGGDKIGPFWIRVVHEHVLELRDLHLIEIPVDTHVRRLTRDLLGREEMDDDRIREYWSWLSEEYDDSALAIDRYLWLIGTRWDDGGEEYWISVTQTDS